LYLLQAFFLMSCQFRRLGDGHEDTPKGLWNQDVKPVGNSSQKAKQKEYQYRLAYMRLFYY
jgi:hypothetical protein